MIITLDLDTATTPTTPETPATTTPGTPYTPETTTPETTTPETTTPETTTRNMAAVHMSGQWVALGLEGCPEDDDEDILAGLDFAEVCAVRKVRRIFNGCDLYKEWAPLGRRP